MLVKNLWYSPDLPYWEQVVSYHQKLLPNHEFQDVISWKNTQCSTAPHNSCNVSWSRNATIPWIHIISCRNTMVCQWLFLTAPLFWCIRQFSLPHFKSHLASTDPMFQWDLWTSYHNFLFRTWTPIPSQHIPPIWPILTTWITVVQMMMTGGRF